jgi:Uma2 family endonuclease
MSTPALVSEEQYLATSFRPDRELVDGRLVERNLGEYDHSNLQSALITWLRNRAHEWKIRALVEQRLRVSAKRYRIPDVCVSKDDTLRSMQERVDDYVALGVSNIWVLDPAKLRAYVCTHGDFREPEGGVLEAESLPIRIPLDDLFADLD